MRPARVVEAFHAYLAAEGLRVTRAELERNLAGKARSRTFLGEVAQMLAPGIEYDAPAAVDVVSAALVTRLPGEPWKGT